MNELERFKELARSAVTEVDRTGNISSIIPICSSMLEIIRSSDKSQKVFAELIIELWNSRSIENGVIEFCCHALKWPRLKDYFSNEFIKAKEESRWDDWQYLRHIVEAFEDDWEDAKDFYAAYFNN
ncbi:MAG: hypothetical protein R3254_09405 [Thiomicrorhabdus sp.]|nr:hypothetical protein [Thiomicrorhabdus sp.]